MSDTVGSLIDKLITVDMKMWSNQEILFKIRHMSFEEFKQEISEENMLKLHFEKLKKCCDLNVQRNQIIDEIDELILKIISLNAKDLENGNFIQKKHKTY